jgi:hypothetical protein
VPPLAGAKRYTTLIVESVFPFSVQPYAPHAQLSLADVPHTQASPEATLLEMLALMRSGDWNVLIEYEEKSAGARRAPATRWPWRMSVANGISPRHWLPIPS